MGKKKRKSGASDKNTTPSKADIVVHEVEDVPVLECMTLRLLSTSKGKVTDPPQIILTKQDAHALDILNDDHVLILVEDSEGVIENTAVCSARIVSTQQLPGAPIKSPLGKNSRLTDGSCHVVPPLLLERLCAVPTGEIPESATIKDAPSTPSKAGPGFSFAIGGGGDDIISPSKELASPTTKATTPMAKSRKVLAKNVWIVPLFNELGSRLAAVLCKPVSTLSLRPTTEVPANTLRVVQKLVSTRISDSYICDGDTIGISFQGKPLHLLVENVTPVEQQGDVKLLQQLDRLTIEDSEADDDALDLMEAVSSAMENPASNLEMFHIKFDTEIVLESETKAWRNESQRKGPFVAGLDDVLEQVKASMLPALLHRESYGDLKPPRGTLLHGSSGVGKSALARQLAANIEKEYPEIDVELVHCASLQSHTAVVGEGERMLSKLFDRTRKTLLIMDDIDFIGSKRGKNPGIDRLTATLLALLDGVDANDNVYLLGTTADPSLLDPALRRPGRLDDEVEIPIPDEKTRAKIWKFHLENLRKGDICVDDFSEEDLSNLASTAKGFNGADCLLAIKEASRTALQTTAGQATVTQQLLKSAIGSIKPSTISAITVEVPKVFWSSIGGMDDVKDKLREAIEFPLIHAELFAKMNIPPPRGVLLYGPPGCSKTLMARALATEGRMNFLAVKGPELLSKWLGESERALASLFRRARLASPCTIFFDEIDAIASKRGGGEGNAGGERLLSQLLTELDGVGSRKEGHVIVVAATNRPDLLDHALTRPGRIDRKIYVGLPDQTSREQIFAITLKNKAHAEDIDVSIYAEVNITECVAHETNNLFSSSINNWLLMK